MDEIFTEVSERLSALGYKDISNEETVLHYNIRKAEDILKNKTNQISVPNGLKTIWIDMAAGMFLQDLKQIGKLISTDFDFSSPVKSITEGDTSVTYALSESVSPAAEFEKMINYMINPSEEIIAKYRKLVW